MNEQNNNPNLFEFNITAWKPRVGKSNYIIITILIFVIVVFLLYTICKSTTDCQYDRALTLSFLFLYMLILCITGAVITYFILSSRQHDKHSNLLFEFNKFNEDKKRFETLHSPKYSIEAQTKFNWENERFKLEKQFSLFQEFLKTNKPADEEKQKLWDQIGKELNEYITKLFDKK